MAAEKESKGISRRKFINLGVQGYAGIGLSQTLVIPFLASSGCTTDATKTVHGACYHDCPDACSWTVTAVENKITKFEASTNNPYTSGKLCSKMDNFPNDVTFHPDRILTPLRRVGKKGEGKFEAISWEQGISEVAERLKGIVSEHGAAAILPYSFAGTEGLVQNSAISRRFFTKLGASQLERTICGDAAVTGDMSTNGTTTGALPEDIIYSRFILLWGTNTVVSNQHLWPLIEQARTQGAKLIVIDPFQSQTAQRADLHIQPRPGTDTALALALIQVILDENLQDQEYVSQYTIGLDQLRKHVQAYNPEAVSVITGLEKSVIIDLAREYAKASPSLIRVLIGLEHQANGASAFRAIAMLPALTGAWRKHGGGLMHMTYELFGQALNWESVEMALPVQTPEPRTVSMIQIGRALTDPDMNPGIQAMIVFNSNPAVIAPNQNLVRKGLERGDLMTVVVEHFLTDTARYADYVFPATTQLEHWDLITSWGQPYINLNQPIIEPLGQSKPNTEFFRLLAKAMGFQEEYLYESDLSIVKKTLETDHEFMQAITFDSLTKTGWAKLNLAEPWMPHAQGNFGTPSGKCEFFSEALQAEGLSPLPHYIAVAYSDEEIKKYPIQLLTPKSNSYFLNSSHANVSHLRKKEGAPYLDIHETDAAARGIADGDEVKVTNQHGQVLVTAKIRSKVKQGVASMPQGFWPSLMKGGSSANALTDDRFTDQGHGAALHETRVEIAKA